MTVSYVLSFCRIAIALIFSFAFIGKIRNVTAFQEAITDFRLLSARSSKIIAWAALITELVVVLSMVGGGYFLLIGFLCAAGLLMIFSFALFITLKRKSRMRCNCFGWTERSISPYDVMRNILLILCCFVGTWMLFAPHFSPSGIETTFISLMAICFVLLATHLEEVVETLKQPFHAFGVSD